MKAAHNSDALSEVILQMEEPVSRDEQIVQAAVELQYTPPPHQPWETKLKLLDALYMGLRGTNSRWVKAKDRMRW